MHVSNRINPVLASLSIVGLSLFAGPGRAQTTEPYLPGMVQTAPVPDTFNDPETHLRVIHLSRFTNNYSGVIYFTYNTFSPDSRLALIDAQFKEKWRYLYTFDFGTMAVHPLVTNRLTIGQVVHPKSGNVYFKADHAAWVIPISGGTPRKIGDIPDRWYHGADMTVNADETLLLSQTSEEEPPAAGVSIVGGSNQLVNVLYTINIKSGEVRPVHRANNWLGHVQFSPTDPDLCMFCHEGNWEAVDRIWMIHPSRSTLDSGGRVTSDAWIAFRRTEPREIVGHEFWQPDGKAIWFQQFYRGRATQDAFLTRMELAGGKTTPFIMPEGYWGIHQTFSPDGTFMISDGTAPKGHKGYGEAKYLSKLTIPPDGSNHLKGERLIVLHDNDYTVEPNPHVSPDNRWIIFTATLHGSAQAYAVELPGGMRAPRPASRPIEKTPASPCVSGGAAASPTAGPAEEPGRP